MKKKTISALITLRNLTAENLGIVIIWAAALAIIFCLACA